MNWFAFSLLSVGALAGAELTQQYLLNKRNPFNERASGVLTFLFQSLLTIPIIVILGLHSQLFIVFKPSILPRMFLVTFTASVAMIFYLRSFKVKNISISAIFGSLSVIVSTTLGIMIFSESTNLYKFVGIGLILMAIVSLNIRNVALEKNHLYGLLSGLMFGVAYTLDKSILQFVHPLVYIFWAFFLVSVFGFLMNPRNVINSVRGKALHAYIPIIASGIGYFLYNLFTFISYTIGGEVGRVDAINNSQVFLIILFEYFVLKHTKGVARKLIAAVIAFSGVLLLGVVE